MKLSLALFYVFILLNTTTYAQIFFIKGDVKTNKGVPIESATVFLEGSTQVTKTNASGEYGFDKLNPGTYTVVVSMLGYSSAKETVIIGTGPIRKDFILNDKSVQLKEVTVGNNFRRKEQMELFFSMFIGRSDNAISCKILNPEVIEFSTNGNLLEATSNDFIIIENINLGYRIKYLIRDFRHNNKTRITVYDGSCIFENLLGSVKQQKKWAKNWLLVYNGSFMHFLRSLYAGNTEEEGFLCDQMSSPPVDTTLFIDIKKYVSKADSNFISFNTKSQLRIFYVNKPVLRGEYIKVHYKNIFENKRWSYLTMYVDKAVIDKKGSYLSYKSFLLDGDWANKRIGDRLPFEYSPE